MATNPNLIIDADLYSILIGLAERARKEAPRLAERLIDELERADVRPHAAVPRNVVTIGSRVTYSDGDRTQVVELVMPRDADVARGRVSVVTPIGAALLGLSAGQQISWEIGYGKVATIDVLEVERDA
jgi:regulator of nucleoside diphosphate kinase